MSFDFEIDNKIQYIVPKNEKLRYASNNIEKNILYHKSFFKLNLKTFQKNYNYYENKNKLSQGGASLVFLATDIRNNNKVVLKELKTTNITKLKREINILNILKKNDFVIPLLDICYSDENFYLVFPYVNCKPTRTLFYKFDRNEAKIFMYNLLKNINKIHQSSVIHRDLKPGNILVNNANDFYIIDFGIADFYMPFRKYCNKIGTRNFKSPEQLVNMKGFDYKIDIWAIGIMFAEIIFHKFPFIKPEEDINTLEQIYDIIGHNKFAKFLKYFNLSENYPFLKKKSKEIDLLKLSNRSDSFFENEPYAIDLLKKLIEINPYKRINAKDALSHNYFNELNN